MVSPTILTPAIAALAGSPAPFVTYYDVASGERIELSGVTTANWVAKTSNLLVDDHDAEPGTRVRVGLPTHWLRVVWLLSCWNVGAAVVDHDAEIGVSGPELVADEPVRLAASLRPLGGRFATPPDGFDDLAIEVPGHGDRFVPLDPPGPDTLAVDLDGATGTQADLAGTEPDPRRLAARSGTLARDVRLVAAALLGGGSLVLVAGDDTEAVERVVAQEGAAALPD